MKVRKFLASSWHVAAAVLVLTGMSCYGAPAGAESGSSDSQLAQLIDSASYSQQDREALKSGLSVALPGAATEHVSQKTIDIQVKNTTADFRTALSLAVKLADHLEAKSQEFAKSDAFKRVDSANRKTVAQYLDNVVEQYRVRTFEALLAHYNRPISVPASVPRTADNADYRALLDVAVRAAVLSNPSAVAAPTVAAKPAEAPKLTIAAAEPVAAEKPAVVEKSAAVEEQAANVEKPVTAEKAVEVEKPVIVETAVEKPAAGENAAAAGKTTETPLVVEKAAVAEKPIVPGKRYALTVGDSLALLGRLNRIPPSAIVDANPGLQPMRLRVGQVVVIPTAEWVNAQKSASQSKDAPLLSSK